MALVKGKGAVGGFKAPSEIRFPPTGLEDGLSYEEFATRVEVVEYVMWVSDIGEEDGKFYELEEDGRCYELEYERRMLTITRRRNG